MATENETPAAAETVLNEFRIPDENLAALQERIAKLSRKAVKLVGQPIVLKVVRTEKVPRYFRTPYGEFKLDMNGQKIPTGRIDLFHVVTIEGPTPKLNGWTFAAAMDVVYAEDGQKLVMVRNAPGETIPTELRDHVSGCDHCGTARQRKTLYVLRKEA